MVTDGNRTDRGPHMATAGLTGGSGGGLTCYLDQGHLVFEYNLMIIDRSIARSTARLAPGKHTLEFDFKYDGLGVATLAFNDLSGLGRSGTLR